MLLTASLAMGRMPLIAVPVSKLEPTSYAPESTMYTVGEVKVVLKPTAVLGWPGMVGVASTVVQLEPQMWLPFVDTGQ